MIFQEFSLSTGNTRSVWRLAILGGILLLAACSHLDPVERNRNGFERWRESDSGYRFMPGDELDVKVLYNPEFSDRVIVAPDGLIHLDLIGAVPVRGRTPEAVEEDIRQRYATELKQPEVTVSPRIFGSEAIYVAGEVHSPGVLKLAHGMSVFQSILEAGGLLETAHLDEAILIRQTPRNTPMMRVVDLRSIMEGRDPAADIALQRFDVVFVPRSDIAEADRISAQYIQNLLPIQMQAWLGYLPYL